MSILSDDDFDDSPNRFEQARAWYDQGYKAVCGEDSPRPEDRHPLLDEHIEDLLDAAEVLLPARRFDQIDPEYGFSERAFQRLCLQAGREDGQAFLDRLEPQGVDEDPLAASDPFVRLAAEASTASEDQSACVAHPS